MCSEHLDLPASARPGSRDGDATIVLDDCAVRRLLAMHEGCHAPPLHAALAGVRARLERLRVVVDYRTFSAFCSIARLAQHVREAVDDAMGRPVALQVLVIGNSVDGACGGAAAPPGTGDAFERLVGAIAGLVFETRRRDEAHFERVALTLPAPADGDLHLLEADALAACLAGEADALPAGATLLYGRPLCSRRELVHAIAQAAGVPVRDATGALPMDAVGELVRLELQQACERELLGREAELVARTDCAVALHAPVGAAGLEWRARVEAIVAPLRAAHATLQAPRFEELPGLAHRVAGDGRTHYVRCGDGPVAVLLVNAFGLTMDVWHELARRLARSVRVLAIEGADAGDPAHYEEADAPAGFARAVQAVLASEGLAACHVASWCAGAKLALGLARGLPAAVSSLALFAPSFAGAQDAGGEGEGDSPFETSLATMCQVVDRMPAAAAGMARSMQAILARGAPAGPAGAADADGAAVFALHDRLTTPWLHAPFASAASMTAYSRQLLAFRAHRIVPAEGSSALPRMLVTGSFDATTNNRRARAVMAGVGATAHFELACAGHYFVHQNAGLVATLLLDFLHHGTKTESRHPRLRRVPEAPELQLVSGEL